MNKINAVLIAVIVVIGMIPLVASTPTTVTGTFTPHPTGISIACNKTAPGFGTINLGENAENVSFNVTNEGDVNCSVKMTAGDGAGTWTLVAGTASPATTNEYCVNVKVAEGAYVDAESEQTISSDLSPAGGGVNYTSFDLKVFVSDFTNEGTPGAQTFYTNLTAAQAT